MQRKDKTLKDKFMTYAVVKASLDTAEQDLIKELNKQLKQKDIKISPEISVSSFKNLRLTKEGVVFDYKVTNYDESEPASVLLK